MRRLVQLMSGLLTCTVALAALVVLAGALLVRTDQLRTAQVLTGSMEPTVATGSVVFGTPTSGAELSVGDVVMFRPPAPFSAPGDLPVVHRVAGVSLVDGVRRVTTQGDANALPDPWVLDGDVTTFYSMRAASSELGALARHGGAVAWPTLLAVPVLGASGFALRAVWAP
ncbi:MAG: signal peptidase, partial [Actinotalea sp.]|nr:signal peptidase [Actinotalea sp.]